MIFVMQEADVWRVWDNMKYFDKNTFEEIYAPVGLMAIIVGTYPEESAVIRELILVKELLKKHNNSVEAVKGELGKYSVLDLFEDALLKRAPRMPFSSVSVFEFWYNIYTRRGLSRALVPVSHYELPPVFQMVECSRLMNDLLIYGKSMVTIGEGEIKCSGISIFDLLMKEKE